jgi:hypothetical protein
MHSGELMLLDQLKVTWRMRQLQLSTTFVRHFTVGVICKAWNTTAKPYVKACKYSSKTLPWIKQYKSGGLSFRSLEVIVTTTQFYSKVEGMKLQ